MSSTAKETSNIVDVQGKRKRAVYVFTIPPDLADDHITASFGMVKLNGDEESTASKKSQGDNFRLAMELARTALVEVDEKKINRAEGQDEAIWRDMDPKLRQTIMGCYAELHTPDDDTVKKVVAGMKVVVR